ncbi:RecQ family ATP-dependent DNA helicase [Actinokineospora bangkokensis]|uniref:RecQ family ATP-dependent DNA helicase n=1 Tax=Actinokineospora bangkokensis TaxID=1193682 RepID=UPI001E55B556|nr:RecQ family ATP-dependent DNA helicase [Actinokineospora bangkokensis]
MSGIARERFGWELTDEQQRAAGAVLDGRDVLAVLPTGAGKSAIYQVPGLALDGLTVVVSPLVALQHDQAAALGEAGVCAVVVNADRSAAAAWEAVESGEARFLLLAPEQLAKPEVVERLRGAGVVLFAVDEAHCVSAWGHDFRPDYLRLAAAVERLGRPPVLALTATAAPPVRDDVVERLGMRDPLRVCTGFDRPNIHLAAHRHPSERDRRAAVLERVRELRGTGLVYAPTRAATEEIAAELGARARCFHAGMPAGEKERVHEAFTAGEVEVVVATSAFGMGIDKPDVRFVLHAGCPDSLDSYHQQVGRAGRDGDPATAELHHRPEDLAKQRFLTATGVPEDAIRAVAKAVRAGRGPQDVDLPRARRTRAVNLLVGAGAVDGDLTWVGRDLDEAVAEAVRLAEVHKRAVRSRVEMVRAYAEAPGCRRQELLAYFGEELPEPCGNCDGCDAGRAGERRTSSGGFDVHEGVRHAEWGRGEVMSVEDDRVTVLFEDEGYRTLSLAAVHDRDLLVPDAS